MFVEDAASGGKGYNQGTWSVQWNLLIPTIVAGVGIVHKSSFAWVDPIPMYHGNVSTFGFADGHAESHKWLDGNLVAAGLEAAKGNTTTPTSPTSGPDYDYIYGNYQFPGWR